MTCTNGLRIEDYMFTEEMNTALYAHIPSTPKKKPLKEDIIDTLAGYKATYRELQACTGNIWDTLSLPS